MLFNALPAHADGDRIGVWRRKGLGETRLRIPAGRHGSSAFAVGRPRKVAFYNNKKGVPSATPVPTRIVHLLLHTCPHTSNVYTHACTHAYAHACTLMATCTRARAPTHTATHICPHTCPYACLPACTTAPMIICGIRVVEPEIIRGQLGA